MIASGLASALQGTVEECKKLAEKFDPRYHRVFSLERKPDYGCRGGLPYFKPNGWVRFALQSPSFAQEWCVAYHGTHVRNVAAIIQVGLQRPGDHGVKSAHGQAFSTTNRSIYVTPSIGYAAFPTYAEFFRIVSPDKAGGPDDRWAQVVLQCRVRPDAFREVNGTLGTKFWPEDVPFDVDFPGLGGLEWLVEDAADVVVTGLMVREFGPGAAAEVFGAAAAQVTAGQRGPQFVWTTRLLEEMRGKASGVAS